MSKLNEANKMNKEQTDNDSPLLRAIRGAESSQKDAVWAVLKYKEIGILRKVRAMSSVLKLDSEAVIKDLPTDDEGRVLDRKTRHMIHDVLIQYS
jgi:hypothetical protein